MAIESFKVLLHPQPDEMTFEQSVMHVRRTMYWSGAKWCDISLYPLGQWKLLEEQLKAAHEREMDALEAENDKLREQIERLVTLLRADCDIDASWDGLRRFWDIRLTEDGCLMRDRACKAEAENAKLRAAVATAILVQTVLCGDADMPYCRESCPLHRKETDDCVACDVIGVAHELGIEVEE